jgi:hypothetical protein
MYREGTHPSGLSDMVDELLAGTQIAVNPEAWKKQRPLAWDCF